MLRMYFLSRRRHLHYFRHDSMEGEPLVTAGNLGGSEGHCGMNCLHCADTCWSHRDISVFVLAAATSSPSIPSREATQHHREDCRLLRAGIGATWTPCPSGMSTPGLETYFALQCCLSWAGEVQHSEC